MGAIFFLLGASLTAAPYRAGNWPLEVTVTPDQSRIVLGEPTWLSFTVANLSGEPLQILVGGDYQNQLGRPASFTVRAMANNGKWADVPDAGEGTGGLIGPRDLPAGGSYVFRLFVPHWATFTDPSVYTIICRRTLQLLRPVVDRSFVKQPTNDVAVEVRAALEVLARDETRMKAVIDGLGARMLASAENDDHEAVISLAWIDDPRVVPYFRRALEIRSYALRYVAVQRLGHFGTDEALAGLKAALALTGSDFDGVTVDKPPELAARIRAAAIGALWRSPHPKARELLIAQQRDPSERVRLAVAQVAPRLPRAQALPLLDEMSKDASADVRAEAQRGATLLREGPGR